MRRALAAVVTLCAWACACAHAPASRWVDASGRHSCVCEGKERNPTPSEAAADSPPGKTIEAYCEGTLGACDLPCIQGGGPFSRFAACD
ncbi:MAG: hypothetical protein U0270_26660 [Labilithrix sp.]